MASISQGTSIGSHLSDDPPALQHIVQFYESDAFLLDAVSAYIGAGLDAGEVCLVIATPEHRANLEQRLLAGELTTAPAHARGVYIAVDAAETLSSFMVDGQPDTASFTAEVGRTIERAAHGSQRQLRIFGEMVALLWGEGNQAAAIRLEELWNELGATTTHPFSLCCAYPMRNFAGKANAAGFDAICASHSHVVPDERYTALTDTDERLRAITLLQQKASSLEAEVAERKAVEERLRLSENRYRRLFEASTDGILIVDPDTGVITDANPVMSTLVGRNLEQIVGRRLWEIGLFPDREAAQVVLCASDEEPIARCEARLRAENGQLRYVELVGCRLHANGRDIMQCNLRDITDRKQLEERKNTFISMASHELRTPVTSLKGFTQILQRRLKPQADPQTLLFLDRMDKQLVKLTNLITELLDVSKMETGALTFSESSVDLDELVRECVENVQAATVTHQFQLHGATHAMIWGDPDRLEQSLINLLTNAVKYSPQADTVVVRLSADQEQADITVQDFGIGIDGEYQERIFERFYQVIEPDRGAFPGLGLGLYIARALVERHGGRLWLESRKGVGSAFHISLPLLSRTPATTDTPVQEMVWE